MVCYVVLNEYLHGKVFLALNFVMDTIFEVIYALFPLLYLSGDGLFSLSSLGILAQQNPFIIIQSFFALILLARKCIFSMRDLDPTYIAQSHWKKVTRKIKVDHLKPWILNKSYNSKIRDQGFGNSDLYRLIVARFESINILSPRNATVEIAGVGVTRISQLHSNQFPVITPHLSKIPVPSASVPETPTGAKSNDHASCTFSCSGSPQKSTETNSSADRNLSRAAIVTNLFCRDPNYKLNGRSIFTTQQNRKCCICGCGCIFIAIGVLLLVFFIGFIENDYKNKCFYNWNGMNWNKSNDDWFELHPELKYFDTNCNYQVVNMFSDYPCNCRQYRRYSNHFENDEFSPQMLESVFVNYNDLQNIYIEENVWELSDKNVEYYFTEEMLNSMQYLQIWNMEYIGINDIWSSYGMSKLQNLEIFRWRGIGSYMGRNTSIPFQAFAKLDKMKAIVLKNIPYLANQEIPDDICNLRQMRYFEMTFAAFIEYIPYDCMAENWKELRFIKFETFPKILYITPEIWKLPHLQTVILTHNGFSVNSKSFDFDTFDGYSNSLATIWLSSANGICGNGSISINNTEYRGFGYLANAIDSGNYNYDNSDLLEFIKKYDPCAATCSTPLGCPPDTWQDGVCSDACNREECNYDGGDCNQLCDCDYDLWFNDKCDNECNTTQCNWDFYQCIDTFGINDTCSSANSTNSDNEWINYTSIDVDISNTPCYVSWIDDTWCDGSCNVESCDYDGGWCDGCVYGSQCKELWDIIDTIPKEEGNSYGNDLVTPDAICDYRDVFVYLFDEFEESDNCSYIFHLIDLNSNGFIGWYEILQFFAFPLGITSHGHWKEKMVQIDCSGCLDNASYYYW